jgi:hypothetical protein
MTGPQLSLKGLTNPNMEFGTVSNFVQKPSGIVYRSSSLFVFTENVNGSNIFQSKSCSGIARHDACETLMV